MINNFFLTEMIKNSYVSKCLININGDHVLQNREKKLILSLTAKSINQSANFKIVSFY